MEKPIHKGNVYIDKEMPLFYCTVAGIPILVCLLAISQHEWVLSLVLLGIALIFLTCGWPLKAMVNKQGEITFIGPIRKIQVTAENLVSVRAVGVNDYRAHIVLRIRGSLPVGYRCRKYTSAAELASSVLELIKESPNANATKDALKLLQRTARGKMRPISG